MGDTFGNVSLAMSYRCFCWVSDLVGVMAAHSDLPKLCKEMCHGFQRHAVCSKEEEQVTTLQKNQIWSAFIGFFLLVVAGCSNGSDENIAALVATDSTSPFGSIRLSQVLLRNVPSQVTQQRFTGFDQSGAVRYGPEIRVKSSQIMLENVSTSVSRLQIEYLNGEDVIGLGNASVALTVGQTYQLTNPPFQDVVEALASIQISPGDAVIVDGTSLRYTAIGTFVDSTQVDLSSSVTWSSSNQSTATITPGGLATATSPGGTTIAAALGPIADSTPLTVSAAVVTDIQISPTSPVISDGTTLQFTAIATLSDGTTQDVTSSVQWTSGSTGVATIDSTGLSTAVDPGQSLVTVTLGSITGTANLTVTQAEVSSIVVTPANPTLANGTSQQFKATAIFTDNSQQDVTSAATWSSETTGVATITASGGYATAVSAAGTTTIEAQFSGVTGSTTLSLTAAEISSITVTPQTPVIADGTTQQFTATASLSDGTTQDVTSSASWTSGATATATIDPSTGLATAVDPGQSIITATVGAVSGTATLTVTSATVSTIAVTPGNPTLANGTTQQFTATATLSDSTTQDITSSATWSSDTPSVATITASGGFATAVSAGGTTAIEAQFSGVTGSTTLSVTAAEISSISVTPGTPAIADGTTQQFTATATLSDGTTQDVTSSATWTSGTTATATIDPSTGFATAVDPGQSIITATVGAVSGTATLTVTSATLESLAILPSTALSAPGSTRQYHAIGTYSDGTTQDLTGEATWSSNSNDVTMLNSNFGSGRIGDAILDHGATPTGSAGTPVTVTATFGSTSANSTLYIGLFGFVANSGDDTISAFSIDSSTGALTLAGSPISAGSFPNKLEVHPWGLFLYSTDTTDQTVATYSINPGTGELLQVGTPVSAGFTPNNIAVDPSGSYAFVADNTVFEPLQVFSVDTTTGELIASTDAAEADTASDVVVHPNGEYVYVTNQFGSNVISLFSLDQDTGLLTFQGYQTSSNGPVAMDISPSGEFLYTALDNAVVEHEVNPANGELTMLGQAALTFGANDLRVEPSGNFVYTVSDREDMIRGFRINPSNGDLTSVGALSTGLFPSELAIEPNGTFVFVVNRGSDDVYVYSINSATGALTLVGSPVAVGSGPSSVTITP
jgi:6-phosphogluconolactonase (cycloisomerase 2 family)